jgi:hypothetical protein
MSVGHQKLFKNANSGAQICEIIKKEAQPEEAQNVWRASMKPVIELIGEIGFYKWNILDIEWSSFNLQQTKK